MQGQRASLSTLTDYGSTSNNNDVDSQMSLNDTNIQYLPHVRREDWNAVWSSGETSSSVVEQSTINETETKGTLNSEQRSNFLSLDNIGVSSNAIQYTNSPLDMFAEDEDDDYQIVERMQSASNLSDSSRKRKSSEPVHAGESSDERNSNTYENAETSQYHAENDLLGNTRPEQANQRNRLGISRGSAESARRNLRLRINGSHQQDSIASNPFPVVGGATNATGDEDVSSSRESIMFSAHEQYIRSVRRNPNLRSGGRDPSLFEEHPIFVPASERGNSVQQPSNWDVGADDNAGIVSSTAEQQGSGLGVNPSVPSWSHRSYPRRLSEIVRRSLASSAGNEAGDQGSVHPVRSSSSADVASLSSGSDSNGRHARISRSALLARHLEIRHVLDLMRRGDGVGIEDAMILDHSVFFGMADIQDRHRDMRLDVDNMSYEELLDLEERIGNVCTGLSEETIVSRLKQHKYKDSIATDQVESEPCSICREEYIDGEDLGRLECHHDFHKDCIKQWLMQKNLCPICKTTGLNA